MNDAINMRERKAAKKIQRKWRNYKELRSESRFVGKKEKSDSAEKGSKNVQSKVGKEEEEDNSDDHICHTCSKSIEEEKAKAETIETAAAIATSTAADKNAKAPDKKKTTESSNTMTEGKEPDAAKAGLKI